MNKFLNFTTEVTTCCLGCITGWSIGIYILGMYV